MSDAFEVAINATELGALVAGLREPQKRVDSKYFYDQRGSELFDEITTLQEYYLTRTELGLLERHAEEIVERTRPATFLELGAGSARKTRVLLRALERERPGSTYAPFDVSADFLTETARELRAEFPELRVTPLVGDFTQPLEVRAATVRPALVALLGSTLGNFSDAAAVGILTNATSWMAPGDYLLLGLDLRPGEGKTREELEAAYDDAQGVTAEFNLNLLRVLNDRFGADFEVEAFEHLALYNDEEGRIEMHLRARRAHHVSLPGHGSIAFRAGETLRTEISCKYDRPGVEGLMRSAGVQLESWLEDSGRYALALGRRRG